MLPKLPTLCTILLVKPQQAPEEYLYDHTDKSADKLLCKDNDNISTLNTDIEVLEQGKEYLPGNANEIDYQILAISNSYAKVRGLPGNRFVNDAVIAGNFLICKYVQSDEFGISWHPISLSPENIKYYKRKFREPEFYARSKIQNQEEYEYVKSEDLDDAI